ncbi:hypothetical protein [Paenibacillus polysaccharolyticus]|uniref:hypothetical protein n=1 Tax=Paenibacillus polysaccharolyticus TaxID=582692 RepID=UPI003009319A
MLTNLLFSYIITALCLPVLLLIYNHSNRFIKWGARVSLISLIFYLFAVVPFVILAELKFWPLLLLVIPIIFRIVSLILDKLGFFSSKSTVIARNLLYASMSALSVIFVGASYDTLEKFFFLIVILIVLFLSDFQIIEKRKYNGAIYGPIVAAVPSYDNINVFITLLAVWLVMTLTVDLVLKIIKMEKSKQADRLALLVYVPICLIINENGGIQLSGAFVILKVLACIVIVCLLMGSSFLINKKVKNVYIRQFSPVFISSGFLCFLLIMINQYVGVREFFSSSIMLIATFCIFVGLCRLILSLDKLIEGKSFPFKMDNINDMMIVIFGKNLGQALFNNLFGPSDNNVHIGVSLGLFFLYVFVGGSLLLQSSFSVEFKGLFYNDESLLLFITANSMVAALILISEIVRASAKSLRECGMNREDAFHSSTLISLEYFFIFVPLLFFSMRDFENINISFIVLGSLFLFLFYANINLVLYFDFKKPQYNQFRKVRLVSSALFQLVSLSVAPLLFFLDYKNQGLFFINQYNASVFLISFLAMFIAKLLGYDTEFGSKKAYKRSCVKLALILPSCLVASYFPFMIYLLVQDATKATYIAVLFLIFLISMLGQELAMVSLPWSNVANQSIVRQWLDMSRKIKADREVKSSNSLNRPSLKKVKKRNTNNQYRHKDKL